MDWLLRFFLRWRRWLDVRQWNPIAVLHAAVLLAPLLVMLPYMLGWYRYESVVRLDQRIYDQRLLWFDAHQHKNDDRVVIVDIDEDSLKQYGRWPWHRDVVGRLAGELLQRQQVAVLGFDVLFAEPDTKEDEAHAPASERDLRLAEQLRGGSVVLGFWFSSAHNARQTGALPKALPITLPVAGVGAGASTGESAGAVPVSGLPQIAGYTASLPQLVQAVPAGGFINALTDLDGELRSIPLVAQRGQGAQARYYPALSLAMVMQALDVKQVRLLALDATPRKPARNPQNNQTHSPIAGVELQQGGAALRIPTDVHGAMLVPFCAHHGKDGGRFRYISAADVLGGKLAAKELAGRMVLVGTTAVGLGDLHATPVGQRFAGVEVHANVIAAMLDGTFIYVPDYAHGLAVCMVLLAALVLALVLPRVGAVGALLWCVGLNVVLTGINFWAYLHAHVALPLAASVLTVLMAYVLHISYGFFFEKRARKQLAMLFGYYVPRELVGEMMRELGRYDMKAQSRELTMMFCDVQNFTRMAEGMEPQQVQALLNRLFNRMTAIVAANQGTIDKYIGDCLMVFWGAPAPLPNHAHLAIKTACDITLMLQDFNREQAALGLPPIQVSIGINTGVVSVGDMGSAMRRSYTVLGDAVNLTARLEPLGKKYGVLAAVGERTVALAAQFYWQWVDTIRVAGKQQAVDVFTPLAAACTELGQTLAPAQTSELAQWQQFRSAYRARNWGECLRLLESLQAMQPDKKLYAIYRQRLQAFCNNPPPHDWDGAVDAEK